MLTISRRTLHIALVLLTVATSASAQALPSPWQSDDIGRVGVAGWATFDAGTFTVHGSGTDIWRAEDSFHFAYVELPYDGYIEARVLGVAGEDPWAKAGVMIRQSLAANSRHESFFATAGNGVAYQRRLATGGISYHNSLAHLGLTDAPFWVRISRRSDFYTMQVSKDRINWAGVGGGDWGPGTVYVGFAVTAHDYWGMATGRFDNVTLTVGPRNIPSEVQITQPVSGQVFAAPANVAVTITASDPDYGIEEVDLMVLYGETWSIYAAFYTSSGYTSPYRTTLRGFEPGSYRIRARVVDKQWGITYSEPVSFRVTDGSLSDDWKSTDIGAVGAAGRFADGDPIVIEGAGADIWGRADAFHYAYRQVTGDWEIVARAASLEFVHAWTKAGVMFRENLGEGSRHVSLFVSANRGLAFQRRHNEGGLSVHTAGPIAYPPVWLRLIRRGSVIAAYYRHLHQQGWQFIGSETVDLPQTIYAGLAVTSHSDGTLATATFDNVTSTAIPEWEDGDIGAVAASGRYEDRVITHAVTGSGADIWGTADEFYFASGPWRGDGTMIARVASLQNTNPWAKAGIMFRETLSPGSKFVTVVVTPSRGVALQYRDATGAAAANVTMSLGAAPEWVRLTRTGDRFTAALSEDGLRWTVAGSVIVSMPADVRAGLPVTSHADGVLATAVFDSVSIER